MPFSDATPTEYNSPMQANSTSASSTLGMQPEYTDLNILPMYRPYNHFPSFANPPDFSNFGDRPYKSAFHPVTRTSNASGASSSTMRLYAPEADYYNPSNPVPNVTPNEDYYQPQTNETDYNLVNNYYYSQGQSQSQSQMTMPHNNSNYNDNSNRNNYLSTEYASNAQSIDTCPYDVPPKQKQTVGEFVSEENLQNKTLIESLKPKNGTTFVYIFHETRILSAFHLISQLNHIYSTDCPTDAVIWDALLPSVKMPETTSLLEAKAKRCHTNTNRKRQISVVDTATLKKRTILLQICI